MRTLLSIAMVAALAACTSERAPAPARSEAPPNVAPATPSPASATPATRGTEARPAPTPPEGTDPQASFSGYGDIPFGTPAAAMAQAWGGELKEVGKGANERCYFMTPTFVKTPAEFNFMISEGRFARFGTESAEYVAPGGGKVGMHEAELQALYHQALQATPHKYAAGKYLSIAASGVAATKLVFETDAGGVVTEWRVGVTPEVDYVEGCS